MTYGEHDPAHAYADRQERTYTQDELDAAVAAERERWIGGVRVSIPTAAMEQEVAAHVRRAVDVTRGERDHARASLERAVRLLTGIHSLLYPAPVTGADGRTYVFRPNDPDPHQVLQELSDRIRVLPDEIVKL